jgi:hypothetical protein
VNSDWEWVNSESTMAGVQQRKRKMVEEEHQFHAKRTAET